MSLRAKLSTAVDKAFKSAGDLKQSGKLSGQTVSSYDLTTGQVVSRGKTQVVDVIITDSNKSDDSTTTYQAILKSGIDLSVYKTLKVGTKTYGLGSYTDNGFIIELTLTTEG